ncbi:hypothetical protein N7474_003602 [Penicillium riverlandense]|uniref:uncharacterized protein n=1 Tax=Penicillium riverlandense TaxID=1903569 RepID=UPI002547BE81|nr:uncharacterized protein N7474_003602 [Penicillium riverlandense]KAJ5818011.1 hypothetical protein N7474_003602 [Penicillium riverlandense]
MIPLLENAISNKLERQVIGLQKPTDFYDLVDFYRDVDHEMRNCERRLPNREASARTSPQFAGPRSRHRLSLRAPKDTFLAWQTVTCLHNTVAATSAVNTDIESRVHEPTNEEMSLLTGRRTAKVDHAIVESDDGGNIVVERKEKS